MPVSCRWSCWCVPGLFRVCLCMASCVYVCRHMPSSIKACSRMCGVFRVVLSVPGGWGGCWGLSGCWRACAGFWRGLACPAVGWACGVVAVDVVRAGPRGCFDVGGRGWYFRVMLFLVYLAPSYNIPVTCRRPYKHKPLILFGFLTQKRNPRALRRGGWKSTVTLTKG